MDDGSLAAAEGFQLARQELGVFDLHLCNVIYESTGECFYRHAPSLRNRGNRMLPGELVSSRGPLVIDLETYSRGPKLHRVWVHNDSGRG